MAEVPNTVLGCKIKIVEERRHETKPSSTDGSEDLPTKTVTAESKRLDRERGKILQNNTN